MELPLPHLIAGLVLVSRLGDVVSTYLATPTLKLEGNPIVRRLRWPFAAATLLLALLPYWSVPLGLVVLVPSLLVSASNSAKLWLVRAVGEEAYFEFVARAAARAKPIESTLFALAPACFIGLLAAAILFFYPHPESDWGYYLGLGTLSYALVLAVYGPLAFRRFRKAGRVLGVTRN